MNEENIPVITDREELYDKCENMEQLFDKYYLPLLDKHYSKTYKLQQENKRLKEINEEHKKLNGELREESKKYKEVIKKVKKMIIDNIEETTYEYIGSNKIKVLLELRMDNDGVNKLLDILKDVK